MMFFLYSLLVTGFALEEACRKGEFETNGRFTGQNIDLDYDASALSIDSGATKLTLQFLVPKRYTEQYDANAFAITFNREHKESVPDDFSGDEAFKNNVTAVVKSVAGTSDSACYSNHFENTTCTAGKNSDWSIEDDEENDCVSTATVTVDWSDVLAEKDAIFGSWKVEDNGAFTEVYLTATVETWTHFVEGDVEKYLGVMTGGEKWTNKNVVDGDTNRKGEYSGDAGASDDHFDFGVSRVIIDDTRYTLYQIPFVLRFPKTVVVSEMFKTVTDITFLSAVSSQDVISVNLNPKDGESFGNVEATLTVQTQYPFGIVGPAPKDDQVNEMVAYIGDDTADSGKYASKIEFVEWDDAGSCMKKDDDGNNLYVDGTTCIQNFKVRITPNNDENPCSVAGHYTFEYWAECTAAVDFAGGCAIDVEASDSDIKVRRTSNAYGKATIKISHQDFCPLLMDEIRVTGDFYVYHDEEFKNKIGTGDDADVYTNDILFFEASYRTNSLEAPVDDFEKEGSDAGGDSMIDYVRAQKIFLDVTIGEDRNGDALAGWIKDDWESNFKYDLGGSRIPGKSSGLDTAGGLTVTEDGSKAEKAEYNIVLCEVPYIPADVIQDTTEKPDDCFTKKKDIAIDYLDFNKVMESSSKLNTIDENEIAFKFRLDERVVPVSPPLDMSYLTCTIQAEVYYKGNRHPTRRLLQADADNAKTRQQAHVMTTAFSVQRKTDLKKCLVDEAQRKGTIQLQLLYPDAKKLPSLSSSSTWSTTLAMQIEKTLGVRNTITVGQVKVGGKAIYAKGRGQNRRRLEEDNNQVIVHLDIDSTSFQKAGKIMNILQDELMDKKSPIHSRVQVFVDASVNKMDVERCGEANNDDFNDRYGDKDRARDGKVVSSAGIATSLFALALAVMAALW